MGLCALQRAERTHPHPPWHPRTARKPERKLQTNTVQTDAPNKPQTQPHATLSQSHTASPGSRDTHIAYTHAPHATPRDLYTPRGRHTRDAVHHHRADARVARARSPRSASGLGGCSSEEGGAGEAGEESGERAAHRGAVPPPPPPPPPRREPLAAPPVARGWAEVVTIGGSVACGGGWRGEPARGESESGRARGEGAGDERGAGDRAGGDRGGGGEAMTAGGARMEPPARMVAATEARGKTGEAGACGPEWWSCCCCCCWRHAAGERPRAVAAAAARGEWR